MAKLTVDEKRELEHWLGSAQDAFWRVLWRIAKRRGYTAASLESGQKRTKLDISI